MMEFSGAFRIRALFFTPHSNVKRSQLLTRRLHDDDDTTMFHVIPNRNVDFILFRRSIVPIWWFLRYSSNRAHFRHQRTIIQVIIYLRIEYHIIHISRVHYQYNHNGH